MEKRNANSKKSKKRRHRHQQNKMTSSSMSQKVGVDDAGNGFSSHTSGTGDIPAKKRKRGRPRKYSKDQAITQTLVAKSTKNFSFFNMGKAVKRMKAVKEGNRVSWGCFSFINIISELLLRIDFQKLWHKQSGYEKIIWSLAVNQASYFWINKSSPLA